MNKFIEKNRKFWSHFEIKNSGQKLLIEEPGRVMILHANAVFTIIINQAKGYTPTWLCGKNRRDHQLIRSYFPNAEIVISGEIWLFKKLYATIIAFIKFVKILFSKNILGFHYDKVKYGDIVYDAYLFENKFSTIKKIDFKVFKIIAKCIFRHIKIKNILQNGNYAGVLVSHLTGISSGVMLRSALRCGYLVYVRTGHHHSTFQCLKGIDKIYSYPLKAYASDIDKIITQLGPNLEKTFLKTLEKEIAGKGNPNSLNAFSKDNRYHTNRESFNKKYGLNPNKKNIFIMLHVFNDHPHSHFKWMLFKDYYDWFIQTLNFAKKNNKVNWIFKQHPSIKNYTTKDVSFKKLFSNCPDNILYIDENEQIDTRSLMHCADLIVTCLGSSGFELPAMNAIPSLVAGDNPYTQLGFTLEPKTKEEYFKILNNADKIKKLTLKAQKQAQATFIHIYKISYTNISAFPIMSETQEKDKNIAQHYWNKIINQYSVKKDIILKELNSHIKTVSKPEFKKLTNQL